MSNQTSDQTLQVMSTVSIGHSAPTIEFYNVEYRVSAGITRSQRGSLVDRGANGGILGNDAHVIFEYENRTVDVTGIDNHEINALKIVDAVGKVRTVPFLSILTRPAVQSMLGFSCTSQGIPRMSSLLRLGNTRAVIFPL